MGSESLQSIVCGMCLCVLNPYREVWNALVFSESLRRRVDVLVFSESLRRRVDVLVCSESLPSSVEGACVFYILTVQKTTYGRRLEVPDHYKEVVDCYACVF